MRRHPTDFCKIMRDQGDCLTDESEMHTDRSMPPFGIGAPSGKSWIPLPKDKVRTDIQIYLRLC